MAERHLGCFIIGDPERAYAWEQRFQDFCQQEGIGCIRLLYDEDALNVFTEMNCSYENIICVGIGTGCVHAAEIAERLPAAGLICIGVPFCKVWQGIGAWLRQRRVYGRLFGVVCPVLLIQPAFCPEYPVAGIRKMRRMLTSSGKVDALVLPDADMNSAFSSHKFDIFCALKAFFSALRGETACVIR